MALTIDNRAQLRRWLFSSAIVIAVHAAVAAAVLTWRIVIIPLNFPAPPAPGPLMIELAPVRSAQPAASPASALARVKDPSTSRPNAASAPIGEQTAPAGASASERSPAGGENAQQPQAATGVNGAAASAPPQPSETQPSGHAATASGGGAAFEQTEPGNGLGRNTAASPTANRPAANSPAGANPIAAATPPALSFRVNPGPLDTSITVVPPLHGKKPTGVMALPGFGTLRPLPGQSESLGDAEAGGGRGTNERTPVLRIPGVRNPGPYGQASAWADEPAKATKSAEEIRTSIGSLAPASPGAAVHPAGDVRNTIANVTATGLGAGRAASPDRIARNAIGTTINTVHGVGEFKPDPVTRMPAAMGGAVINGREMTRPELRNVAIGGPARSALPGVLSGTSFPPRRR